MTATGTMLGQAGGRSERWADLGLVALGAAVVVLACVAFNYDGPGESPALRGGTPLEVPPDRILLSSSRFGESELERGEQLYGVHCLPCHGKDGNTGLAGARRFGLDPFQNTAFGRGAHPVSLFDTLQNGFRRMMPQNHLSAADRMALIHYLRERLVRNRNPSEYVDLEILREQQPQQERRR